ncbi:MAG: PEP-CTERM sorting domain-containing protein [Acidobacteriota bacterium]
MRLKTILLGALVCASASVSWAGLLGAQVTGTLNFGANPLNYFNSTNAFVPGGCQNSGLGSATVTIVNPTTEFCFADGANIDSANFTDTTLAISDQVLGGAGAANWVMTFTFAPGLVTGVTENTDNFPNAGGVTAGFASNVLTLTWAGTGTPGTFNATYTLTSGVPEPSSALLLGGGLLAMATLVRKRRVKA